MGADDPGAAGGLMVSFSPGSSMTLAGDEGFQRRFIRESQAAAAIDDPHIVPVFAAGQADGVLFIAMRYVVGGDARSMLIREGPLPPDRVADIVSPVASALDAAHSAGLVHRDVKPSNMLMDVRIFSATSRFSRSSRARNTTAIPPDPTRFSSRYPASTEPARNPARCAWESELNATPRATQP